MEYATGQIMRVGDRIIADGMTGIIVCDFDSREFAEGYSGWDMPDVEMLGGGTLSAGIMVMTAEGGLIHYEQGTGIIELAP